MDPGVAIPILPSRDLNETRAFYERLGFHAAGWRVNDVDELYAEFRAAGLTISGTPRLRQTLGYARVFHH